MGRDRPQQKFDKSSTGLHPVIQSIDVRTFYVVYFGHVFTFLTFFFILSTFFILKRWQNRRVSKPGKNGTIVFFIQKTLLNNNKHDANN